jgi:small multidrug resistance pump
MCWVYLLAAILLEICGTTCMKLSLGFTRFWPSVLLFVFYSLSFAAVTLAIRHIEVSVAYAIWSGVGTALIATIGILWFKEAVSALKLVSLVLIVVGIVGLRLSGPTRSSSSTLSEGGAATIQNTSQAAAAGSSER